jgi:hypothetical protein
LYKEHRMHGPKKQKNPFLKVFQKTFPKKKLKVC